jgi:hypothetical protein
MLEMLFETGHPWITWKDPANVRNPQDHCGVIHNSNLCTEIELNTSSDEVAVCNLVSINIAAHLRPDGSLDQARLRETVSVVMRALDNVIDINFYPVEASAISNRRHRPVGLGVMGGHLVLPLGDRRSPKLDADEVEDVGVDRRLCPKARLEAHRPREVLIVAPFVRAAPSRAAASEHFGKNLGLYLQRSAMPVYMALTPKVSDL